MLPASKRQTILIIDDTITNLKVAVEYLQAYSFEILTARNGEMGIDRAQLAQPDLILLDVQMPGIDGFETCRRLKANPATKDIPIIFMTVLTESAATVRGLEAGAVDFVSKPIEATELLARVTTHLKVRALQEQLHHANEQLEERVRERTAALEEEITQRIRHQGEKETLLELVRQQSEQLREITQVLLNSQAEQQHTLQIDVVQIERDLGQLEAQLSLARQLIDAGSVQAGGAIDGAQRILSSVRQYTLQVSSHLDQATSVQQHLRGNPLLNLSDREYEVFQLLVQGRSNGEIAEILVLAKTTVSTHQRRIMEKLGVSDLPSLVKFAIQHNLV
ncbi:MAG TPA: response regulator [Herpetosiphonaceae bacterium]|nr:response regulator [Herpetosiphonaceae bacterium]